MEGNAHRLGDMPEGKASQRERDLLAPRKYQLEILAEARQRNTIAYLETGTGKTLISVLLIKALSADLRKRNGKKLAAFIVPLVPLVHQQAEVIRVHTDLRVGHYYGDMGVDFWKAERWAEEMEKNQVLVCTAQVLLNALRHGFLRMAQLRLLIVDECHHAHGRHPYRQIFTEFYHAADVANRPAVFGMTASPVNTQGVTDLKDCARQMAALERTLDCTIFALEDRDSIETFAPTPNEIVLHYDSEGVVDSGLMRRLQKLIHRAERAGEEEKRRAAEAEQKRVEAEAEQKISEAEADARGVKDGDEVGGKAAEPGKATGMEAAAKGGDEGSMQKEAAKPEEQESAECSGSVDGARTDGQSDEAVKAAEVPANPEAVTRRAITEVVGEADRTDGTKFAAEKRKGGAENGDGDEKPDESSCNAVWGGAEPIGAEAGKLAARLLTRVKHTWEELGQFCAFKATERLLAQLSEEAAADALVFAGLDVGRARHERAVQRWFLGHARTLLECDASELQEGAMKTIL
ncbi:hypothetical protein KFL_003840065 [Klebsormidium nitens]|uniref:Helicase ATP-binding domain-containing protein n=1 Tax=Klebsormidium nitens TaxID=105231 RepID=A0A1Y1IGM2_KLENI|nr:hypothetical protein KFL_003840065 [Klebsormidium nitens]|eukprot:GAQ87876.1 hypothetical protein KFL_003840065 [Klebsormidium nitens]